MVNNKKWYMYPYDW